jgi:hypothetical protein
MHLGLTDLVNSLLEAGAPPDERAIAGNFRMEERPPAEVRDTYESCFPDDPLKSIDDWRASHGDFLDEYVNLTSSDEHPLTFRAINAGNLKPQDPITVLRIESLEGAITLSGTSLSVPEIERRVHELHTGTADKQRAADRVLSHFVDDWNAKRDRRPQFATNLVGVQDLVPDDPWSGTDCSWVSDLRDHLGLGAYVPKASGEPFPVLIMVYPLAEVTTGCRSAWDGRVAVPTVLDGDLFEYFFPSPIAPDPTAAGEHYPVGRTLNLSAGLDSNDYGDSMGTEFLHPCFNYRPQHCWVVGYIDRHLAADLSLPERRGCHLEWIRLWAEHAAFGEGIPL